MRTPEKDSNKRTIRINLISYRLRKIHSRALGPYWKETHPNKSFYSNKSTSDIITLIKESLYKRKLSLESFYSSTEIITEMLRNYED